MYEADDLKAMGVAGNAVAQDRYEPNLVAGKTVALYQQIIADSNKL